MSFFSLFGSHELGYGRVATEKAGAGPFSGDLDLGREGSSPAWDGNSRKLAAVFAPSPGLLISKWHRRASRLAADTLFNKGLCSFVLLAKPP